MDYSQRIRARLPPAMSALLEVIDAWPELPDALKSGPVPLLKTLPTEVRASEKIAFPNQRTTGMIGQFAKFLTRHREWGTKS